MWIHQQRNTFLEVSYWVNLCIFWGGLVCCGWVCFSGFVSDRDACILKVSDRDACILKVSEILLTKTIFWSDIVKLCQAIP